MFICELSIVIRVITEGDIVSKANIGEFEIIIINRIACIKISGHLNLKIVVPLDKSVK